MTLVYKHFFRPQCGSCHPQVFSISWLLNIISLASQVTEIVNFNLLTYIFWQKTICQCGICPLWFPSVNQGRGWVWWLKNCHLILSSCVNALNKEWAPLGSLYNGRNSPYGLYLFSYPISSFHPWKETAKRCHQFCFRSREQRWSDSPFCDHHTTDFWSPAQSLELSLKFLAVVKSPLPAPDGFDFNFLDKQVCVEQRIGRRGLKLKGSRLSNTLIESNTALSKHWPTMLLWSLPEWIICQMYTDCVNWGFPSIVKPELS